MTQQDDFLSDLISEGKNARRQETIAKAAKRVADADAKKPLENGPPIRRDIYQQLEWRALSVTLVTIHTTCRCCGHTFESPNRNIFIERYHRRHGRHLVEAHNFNLMPRDQIEALPRKVETHFVESLYCHQCFINQQEPLCLEPTMTALTPVSSQQDSVPCVPQAWAMPSPQPLWSDTFSKTLQSTASLSSSSPTKPNGATKEFY